MTKACVYVTGAGASWLSPVLDVRVSRDVRRLMPAAAMGLGLGVLGGALAAQPNVLVAPRARFTLPAVPAYGFRLRDQDGHWTTLRQAHGNVLVLTFLYSTCHDLCPAQAKDIVQAVQAVGSKRVEI